MCGFRGFVAQLSLGDSLGESSALGAFMPKLALPKYRTMNWSAYNAALKQRGSLDVWFDLDMEWLSAPAAVLVASFVYEKVRRAQQTKSRVPEDQANRVVPCMLASNSST